MKSYKLTVNKIIRFVFCKDYLIINKDKLLRYYENNKNRQLINFF